MTTVHPPIEKNPALPVLREALRSGSPADQLLAAERLGQLGDGTGTGVLESAVSDEGRPLVVRRAAATALGRIGWTRSTDPLSRVLAAGPLGLPHPLRVVAQQPKVDHARRG